MTKQQVNIRLFPEFAEAASALAALKGQTLSEFVTDAVCNAVAQAEDLPAEYRVELVERALDRFQARIKAEGYSDD